MSVTILIKFKALGRAPLSIPVATQGAYHTVWQPLAGRLGLQWISLFEDGVLVGVDDLAAVIGELQELRRALAGDSKEESIRERIEFILEQLDDVNLGEVAEVFVG